MQRTFVDHEGRRQTYRKERDEIEVWKFRCGFVAVCVLWAAALVLVSGIL